MNPRPDDAALPDDHASASSDHLARNSAVQAVGTLVSRVLGFVRTAMFTVIVATSLAGDAFTIANQLPTQLYVLISEGVLAAVLVPQITKAMLNKERGQDFIDRLLTLAFLVLAGVTAIGLALTPAFIRILASGRDPQTYALTLALAYLCMPQIFFYGMYSVLGQVLNARGRFGEFAWAPAWANVVQIIGLVIFIKVYGFSPDPAQWTPAMIWLLGGTTTLGIVIQGVSLMIPLVRTGFRYHPRFGWRGRGFGAVSRMALWSFSAVGISQLGGFFTTTAMSMARGDLVDVAGNAAQQNAYSLFILPHSVITMSVIIALFPSMARAFQRDDLPEQRRLILQGMRAPSVLTIPASVGLIALSFPMLRTLYWLNERETRDVAIILACMAIGLLPFGITTLKHNYLFAREAGRLNFYLMVLQTGVQVLFSWLAVVAVPPRFAVAMVSLGATMATLTVSVVFIAIAKKQLDGLAMADTYRLWTRVTIASVGAGVIGWFVSSLIAGQGDPRLWQALSLGIGGIVFLGIFWILSQFMHIGEVTESVQALIGRIMRRRR